MFDEDIKIASLGKDKPQKNEHEKVMDEYFFMASYPVKVNGKVVGVVFAVKPVQSSLREYTTNMAGMYLSSALFAAALSFLVIYAFTAKMTKPLRQMSNAGFI